MKRAIYFMASVVFFLIACPTFSQPITEVIWTTPEWEGLTSSDGTGLYHDLISKIYGRAGIKVNVIYQPWARGIAEVLSGMADFTGGDSLSDKFAQPKVPIISNAELIFYKKTTIPSYRSVEDIDSKSGVWIVGYIDNMPDQIKKHIKGTGNTSRTAALQMVLNDRADYYLDNDYQMPQTLKVFEGKYKAGEFKTDRVYVEDLFLCFTKSPRGQRLADIFDQGMKKLAASGELKKIYAKWKRTVPRVK